MNTPVSFSHFYLPSGRQAPQTKEQTQLLRAAQRPVPPKPSVSPPLLLPPLMPGDSLSQEGIYFCIIG